MTTSQEPASNGASDSNPTAWDIAVSPSGPSHFRPDIEGLRAIAIVAVLLFHADFPGMNGGFIGVDVFFVISGFLITSLLLREITSTGRVDFAEFYARRAKRLLPAALVVITATVVASYFILSSVDFPSVAGDGTAAALYVSNYRFALTATDYFAQDVAPSPLLHYWSLGLEEQFYLFWPLLMFIGARLMGLRRLWALMAAVAIGSFALSVYVTDVAAPWAFYSLPTRAWQLALGAVIAPGLLNLPRRFDWRMATVVGAAGLALIGAGVLLINGSVPFPGFAASLPAAGAACLIVSGERAGSLTARFLTMSPLRWVGRISYSLYLWHWPILILVPQLIGHHDLETRIGLAVGAVIVAELSTRYVEAPFRFGRAARFSSRRTLAISGIASLAIASGALVTSGSLLIASQPGSSFPELPELSSQEPPPLQPRVAGPLPAEVRRQLHDARHNHGKLSSDGCLSLPLESSIRECDYGDPHGATVVLFGDSHAGMWFPAVERIASAESWRIIPLVKLGCPPVEVTVWDNQLMRAFHECDEWRELAFERISALHPSITFVVTSRAYRLADDQGNPLSARKDEVWKEGLVASLARAQQASSQVVLIGDSPHPPTDPVECLATTTSIETCEMRRSKLVNPAYEQLEKDAAGEAGVVYLRTTDWLCSDTSCPLVMGGYLVYRNPGHLTLEITAALAPRLMWELDQHGVRM
jgi:peptidoglycan/LPS O-acetylase OafA/YrhL